MNPCDWDVLPPSTPSGTLRATDESPGECHPQEHPNEFDKDAFCGTTSPGVEFGRVSSASNSHGAGPSNQRAETRSTSSIVNFRALHGQRYNGELLRPQLHRETPGNGTQQSLLEGGPRGLGRMAFSFGGRTGGFPPNPEGNHNNNINNTGEGFHPYQHAENARDAVNPLIHKFYHLPPLRNLKMAHPEKVELPPIMGVLGDVSARLSDAHEEIASLGDTDKIVHRYCSPDPAPLTSVKLITTRVPTPTELRQVISNLKGQTS